MILSLAHPFEYDEVLGAKPVRQKQPYATHKVIHMQGHNVRTRKNTVDIRLQEVRPRKLPLGRRNSQKQIRKCAEPYLTAQTSAVIIQHRIILLIKTSEQHNTHQISERILDDLPIPCGCLGIPRQDIAGQAQALPHVLGCKVFAGKVALIQEKGQIPMLPIDAHAR